MYFGKLHKNEVWISMIHKIGVTFVKVDKKELKLRILCKNGNDQCYQ